MEDGGDLPATINSQSLSDAVGGAEASTEAVREGRARIMLDPGQQAFYNPAQVVNRDISIAVLRQFVRTRREEIDSGELRPRGLKNGAPSCLDAAVFEERQKSDPRDISILEGLAASGLRAIRYALEVDGVSRVDANDIDSRSVEAIEKNARLNGEAATSKVRTTQSDARVLMLQRGGAYDVVDLDPYGSPANLLDSAVQAVAEGGMLMVTATDMAVLCGNHGEACWAKYGSYPLHKHYCHEMALRILLAAIQSHAARHKRVIRPVVSLSIDFYVRVFVRVHTSPAGSKDAAWNLAYCFQSVGCESFYFQRAGRKEEKGKGFKHSPGRGPVVPQKCPETDAAFNMGGPFWAEAIHDEAFVRAMLDEVQAEPDRYPAHKKLKSLLTTVLDELPDVPLYYSAHDMSKLLRTPPPSHEAFRSALINAGFRASPTHAHPLGTKTDAPPEVVWDVMREWARQHASGKRVEHDSPAGRILARKTQIAVNFSRAPRAVNAARQARIPRFPPNPSRNWGPMRKHTRQLGDGEPKASKRQKTAASDETGTANGGQAAEAEHTGHSDAAAHIKKEALLEEGAHLQKEAASEEAAGIKEKQPLPMLGGAKEDAAVTD